MLNRLIGISFIFLVGCGQGFERKCQNTYARWPGLPVAINPVNLNNFQMDALNDAISIWNNAMERDVFVISKFSNNTIEMGGLNFPYFVQGVTLPSMLNNKLFDTDIYIKPTFNVDLRALLTHELGHALGIDHINGTIMNPYLPWYSYNITIEYEVLYAAKCLYDR